MEPTKSPTRVKTFVLAGTFSQYVWYMRDNRDKVNSEDCKYIEDFFRDTCGFICDEARILLVGTWMDRTEVPYIIWYARQRGFKICLHYDGHEQQRIDNERKNAKRNSAQTF